MDRKECENAASEQPIALRHVVAEATREKTNFRKNGEGWNKEPACQIDSEV